MYWRLISVNSHLSEIKTQMFAFKLKLFCSPFGFQNWNYLSNVLDNRPTSPAKQHKNTVLVSIPTSRPTSLVVGRNNNSFFVVAILKSKMVATHKLRWSLFPRRGRICNDLGGYAYIMTKIAMQNQNHKKYINAAQMEGCCPW